MADSNQCHSARERVQNSCEAKQLQSETPGGAKLITDTSSVLCIIIIIHKDKKLKTSAKLT